MTTYRMRDLERVTGLPRSTIHFYIREGLLPEPVKTAHNAALYSEEHRVRLETIRRLRSRATPAPLSVVRRALDLIDKGVPPETAVGLQESVVDEQPSPGREESYDAAGLAEAAGVEPELVDAACDAGLLLSVPAAELPFDGYDLLVLRRLADLREVSGLAPEDLREAAMTLRRVIRLEMELRDRLVRARGLDEAAAVSLAGQRFVNVWHPYLSSRARLHEIRARGVGVDEESAGPAASDRNIA